MKVLVCGGRDYINYDKVKAVLDDLEPDVVIHGGARGADGLAGRWAAETGTECVVFKADWGTHGKKAGVLRNRQMLDEGKPDLVIAFPGGAGTADMVRRAVEAGVEVWQP